MMKKLGLAALGILLVAVLSACGTAIPASSDTTQNAISVTGNGQVRMTPDIAYIYVGVHSEADDVADALDENNRQAQAISDVLSDMGINQNDIQTTAFNVYPMQEYGPMGEITKTKYSVDNTVMVTVRDLSSLGALLDSVVNAGANSINSISFDAQNKDAAYSEARRLAVEDARSQAVELAAAAGIEVGEVTFISVYSSGPVPLYEAKTFAGQGGAQVPVAAGEIVISVDANVSFRIK